VTIQTKENKMKRTVRYVFVDEGYGPAEHWVKAKVIESRMCKDLFDGPDKEQLLVELPGGERFWAAFWEELPNSLTDGDEDETN
jgi:hypothetical protein